MVRIIPARIENGHVIPDEPIPDTVSVRGVSIVLELDDSADVSREAKEAGFARLCGLLKATEDAKRTDEELKEDYVDYLDRKYR